MATVLVVFASAPVIGFAATTAPAAADSVSNLRTSIDDVAQRWFDAQADVQRLNATIAANEQRINDLNARAYTLRREATARAVDMYVGKPNRFVEVFTGRTALDSARVVELIDRANAKGMQTFDALDQLTNELKSQRTALTKQRDAKRAAVDSLARNRATLDAQLRVARKAAAQAAVQRFQRAARAASAVKGASPSQATPQAPPPAASAPAAVVVAAPVASQGVHPMHDHPFLVCTRGRESRGIYTVVSASGLYYGAYQFLKTTWDVTALHAGRSELVGVAPNTASEYDQDDLAWTLYQWQGNSPWGGRC